MEMKNVGIQKRYPCLFLLLLHPASFHPVSTVLLCILWGFAINFYNLTFQTEIIKNAPQGNALWIET